MLLYLPIGKYDDGRDKTSLVHNIIELVKLLLFIKIFIKIINNYFNIILISKFKKSLLSDTLF